MVFFSVGGSWERDAGGEGNSECGGHYLLIECHIVMFSSIDRYSIVINTNKSSSNIQSVV